jgi:hypothetical protein
MTMQELHRALGLGEAQTELHAAMLQGVECARDRDALGGFS